MKTKIIISILLCLVVYQQGIAGSRHPIGPNSLSIQSSKQRLYYNNLGTRLDCSANGSPKPVLTWFRSNGSDDRALTFVQSSELINVYENGSLFIRPFRDYSKSIHAGTFVCRAENAAGSIQTTPIQLKPQIYDTYEVEVKNTFGFEQSSVILSCEISPPSALSYVQVIGWLEKVNKQLIQLDLQPKTRYNILSNKNLIIHNISKSDENRSYACIVNNQIDHNTKQSRFKPLRVRDRSPFGPELSVPNNTEYRAQAGERIELPCGISSIPSNARVTWWKNGIEIPNHVEHSYDHSLILKLSTLSTNDSGHYVCRIDDDSGGRLVSHMILKVDVPNQCHMFISDTTIDAGSSVELTCTSNALQTRPNHWQWYHNSALISLNRDRFSIVNATREHMGMYQCCYIIGSSESNDCCAQTQLRIINSPPFILADSQTSSNVIIVPMDQSSHASIDLNCTIYADPMSHVEIFKDGQSISRQPTIEHLLSGDIFVHHRVQLRHLNDTGLYECRANNSLGSTSRSKHINIERQTPFIQSIENQTIFAGRIFTLACYASGQPNLHLTWIDETTKQIVNTSSTSPLILTSISTKSNVYTCRAQNSYGDVSTQVFVTIQMPAKILSTTTNQTMKVNQTLDLQCTAEGDNQLEVNLINPKMQTIEKIISTTETKKSILWKIERIQMSDQGVYQCFAKNNYSHDRSLFQIIVQNIPDRIDNVFIDTAHRISWSKPFNGNANISHYILRIRSQQGFSWSDETIIIVNNTDQTSYSFEHIYSKCTLSITIQAVNSIGASLPSDPLHLQTTIKRLVMAPSNLTAVNISSKSATLFWQYPTYSFCHDSSLQYVIEIMDAFNQTKIQTYQSVSNGIVLHHLKSFSDYRITIYAVNELGASPRSTPLMIRTLENVPLLTVTELSGILLNSSTARVTWIFEPHDFQLLNGKFRTYLLTIYRDFNMSTLQTIETIHPYSILNDLQSASSYFLTVAVCNHFDCGPSSSAIKIETSPISSSQNVSAIGSDSSLRIAHPVNKPLLLHCSTKNAPWFHREKYFAQYILSNQSLYIPHPKMGENDGLYRCASNVYNVQLYDKPVAIQTKIHYTTSNEISLKFQYSMDIVDNLTITYQTRSNGLIHELHVVPPLPNIQLSNLSCGHVYEIVVNANNQAGSSRKEYLIGRTDGSAPQLIDPSSLFETVTDHYIILNFTHWQINQCAILSYEVDIFPTNNQSDEHIRRSISNHPDLNDIRIESLRSNQEYQMHLKILSQAGEITKILTFRTRDVVPSTQSKGNHSYTILIIVIIALIFILLSSLITCLIFKICRQHWSKADLFVTQTRKLKPVIFSSYPNQYQSKWLKSNNEFTIENYSTHQLDRQNRPYSYASEDSQGNINPYAVTGCTLNSQESSSENGTFWRENKHTHCLLDKNDPRPSTTPSERYFRPIILESTSLHHNECLQRNPLVHMPSTTLSTNSYQFPAAPSSVLSTVSSSQGELFSAFTSVPPSKHTTLNTKKQHCHHHHHHQILTDQSSSSADSGVHSSCTQSPIAKHSLRRCPLQGFSFDRPSSANAPEEPDKHFYATYDQQFSFLRESSSHHPTLEITPPITARHHGQEQYSLV